MNDFERNKDQVQAGVQAGASLVGRIAVIITDAIGSIARESETSSPRASRCARLPHFPDAPRRPR